VIAANILASAATADALKPPSTDRRSLSQRLDPKQQRRDTVPSDTYLLHPNDALQRRKNNPLPLAANAREKTDAESPYELSGCDLRRRQP
jgi:hypothetical protein